MQRTGNYEISKKEAWKVFLKYDQKLLIRKFSLDHDKTYLYASMLGKNYRINRTTAYVESSPDHFLTVLEADFEETLSLFDLLCYGNSDIFPSGEWALVNSLPGTPKTVGVNTDFFQKQAEILSKNKQLFQKACERLHGTAVNYGDIGYEIPVFRKLSVIVQLYEADEDFPAKLHILWDKHTLQYLHYETTFYLAGLLMKRILKESEIFSDDSFQIMA